MKKAFLLTIFWVASTYVANSQSYSTQKYDQVSVKTVEYLNSLEMDIYQSDQDSSDNRTVLIYVHGGGFSGGARNEPEIVAFCENMAKRGVVTVSISYTLTMKGKSFGCNQAAKNKLETFRIAANEVTAATHYLLERKEELRINDKNIVLSGSSAGAEAVIHAAYLEEALGNLPKDFKYGGLVSMAGAISDIDLITKETAIPMQFFHGTCDELVPYGNDPHHFCSENDPGYLMLYGAGAIIEKLGNINQPYYLITACNGDHTWASIPFRKKLDEIAEFIEKDVVQGKFRQVKEVIGSDGSCDLVDTPDLCQSSD